MSDQVVLDGSPTAPSRASTVARKRRWWWASVVALSCLIGVGVGYALPHSTGQHVVPTARGEDSAVGLVTAMRRPDGLRFGDWARVRMTQQCQGYDSSDFDFFAGPFGGGPSGRLAWLVEVRLRHGAGPGRLGIAGCPPPNAAIHPMAKLDSGSLAVLPAEDGHDTWLDQFRRGDPA